MNKSYFCRMFFLKYNRSIVILWRTTSMDFQKVIYENVEKRAFISQQTYLYRVITDILKFYEVLFTTSFKGVFCL